MLARVTILSLVLSLIILSVSAEAQVKHTVNQVDLTFVPNDLTIAVGDTVRWVHSLGIHTVTSGLKSTSADVGVLFDSPLSAAFPSFEYVFTSAGEVPYFCRPHEIFDMKAIIRVEEEATPAPPVVSSLLELRSIQPNPFNPRASIRFVLGSASQVSITVHDVRGRLVRQLANAVSMPAGEQQLIWDGKDEAGVDSSSGVYHFRIRARDVQQSVQGVLVR